MRLRCGLVVCFVFVAFASVAPVSRGQSPGSAAQRTSGRAARPASPNPAFQPVQDDPQLPRVLLIGDSISIGYTVPLRQALAGKANVHRPPVNCGPTTVGLKQLDRWLGDTKWDLIHFNWGLHDLKYMGPDGQNLADPSDPANHRQVPPQQYGQNLRKLVARLKKTGAILVWRSTTPIPQGAKGRVVGDEVAYNRIAARVMKENHILIDDMYTFAKPRLAKIQRPANVHFTDRGSQVLAEHSAEIISAALRGGEQ